MITIFKRLGRVVVLAIAAGSLTLALQPAMGQETDQMESNRNLVAKGFQAWADGTGSPYDLLAEDARWTITGNSLAAKTYPTKEAFMREVIRPFNARMRDRLVPTVHRLYVDGDTVIAFFDAKGVARDGQPYVNTYAWILKMREGRITEAHAFFDSIAFDAFWRRVEPASSE